MRRLSRNWVRIVPVPPRPVVAVGAAFLLGAVRMDSDLSWPMVALWIAVGAALGHRLPRREAVTTGIVFGACLGFASTFYGNRGHLLFLERLVGIAVGVAIGAVAGAIVTAAGSAASLAILDSPPKRS